MKPFACLLVLLVCLCVAGNAVAEDVPVNTPVFGLHAVVVDASTALLVIPCEVGTNVDVVIAGANQVLSSPQGSGKVIQSAADRTVLRFINVPASLTVMATFDSISSLYVDRLTYQAEDADCDGRITVLDLLLIRAALGTSTPSVADVNRDDSVDVKDLLAVRTRL